MNEFDKFSRLIGFGTNFISRKIIFFENDDLLETKFKLHFAWDYPTFEEELNESLNMVQGELVESLSNIDTQFEKLRFITKISVSTESLSKVIFENKDGLLSHANYHKTSGIGQSDQKYTEADFQEYYSTIKWYCTLLSRYLEGLRGDVIATNPEGFIKQKQKNNLVPSPLEYFDDLFVNKGLQILWNEFKPSQEDMDYHDDVDFDNATGIKKIYFRDQESGKLEYDTEVFETDFLYPKLRIAALESRKKIDSFMLYNTFEKKQNYIDTLLLQIDYLLTMVTGNSFASRFPSCTNILNSLTWYCKKVYGNLLVINVASVKSKSANSKQKKDASSSKTSFSISANPKNKNILTQIYNLEFGDNYFIDKDITTEENFINFFTAKNVFDPVILIHTACQINEAAYIISKMKVHFSGIDYELISKSKSIIKKGNKGPFTAGQISTYNSKLNTTASLKHQSVIDDFFHNLKKIK